MGHIFTFNGKSFGFQNHSVFVGKSWFTESTMRATNLLWYPFRYQPNRVAMEAALIKRGSKFIEICMKMPYIGLCSEDARYRETYDDGDESAGTRKVSTHYTKRLFETEK